MAARSKIIKSLIMVFFACPLIAEESAEPFSSEILLPALQGDAEEVREYSGESLDSLALRRRIVLDSENIPRQEDLFDGEGNLKSRKLYTHSGGGAILKIEGRSESDQILWTYQYEYGESNLLMKETSLDGEGQPEGSDLYTYGEGGLLLGKKRVDSAGAVSLEESYTYDEESFLTGRTTLFGDGSLLKRVSFSYDDGGRLSEEKRFDANGAYETASYTYEGDRLTLMRLEMPDGTLKKEIRYRYGLNGELLSEESIAADGSLMDGTRYIYDDRGNWVRKSESKGNFTLRLIKYSR